MPCKQQVKVTYDKKKHPLTYELLCSGQCDDDKKDCKRKEVPSGKPNETKQFCACNEGKGDEPLDCHIVLYTVKTKRSEEHYFTCEIDKTKKCPAGQKCVAVPVERDPFPDDATATLAYYFECRCVDEDKTWPEK